MKVYQALVDDMRRLMYNDVAPEAADVARTALRYQEISTEVNRRLRECEDLLHNGHRTEAVERCEYEPNLLDAVGVLDFPERDEWIEMLREFNQPFPPDLEIDIAGDLNEAYDLEQKLEPYMRKHRLHALARSPLRTRINLMRKLAATDKNNPVWAQDVRIFEKERHRELEREIREAEAANNVEPLAALETEIRNTTWLEPPPAQLADLVVTSHNRVRGRLARAELEQIQEDLNDAFAALDVSLAKRLRDRWNARLALVDLPGNDPLFELVEAPLSWLEEEERREREQEEYDVAVANLERALDKGAPREELERLYHFVGRHEQGVPEVLARRLQERIHYMDVAARRRSMWIVLTVVVVFLFAAGVTAYFIYRSTKQGNVAKHVSVVTDLNKKLKYDEADKFIEKVKAAQPEVFAHADFQKQVTITKEALLKRSNLQQQFQEMLEGARSRVGVAVQAVEAVDPLDPVPVQTAIDDARRDIEAATAFCASQEAWVNIAKEAERVELVDMAAQLDNLQAEKQQKIDDQFLADRKAWEEQVGRVNRFDETALKELQDEGKTLKDRPYATLLLKSPIDPQLTQLQMLVNNLVEKDHVEQLLRQITGSVGTHTTFIDRLNWYTTEYPDHPRSAEFKRVVEQEEELWEGVSQWNSFITNRWVIRDVSRITPAVAESLIDSAENLLADHGDFPPAENLRWYLPYLEAITQRVDGGESITSELSVALSNETVANLSAVELVDGTKYYFRGEPDTTNIHNNVLSVYYFTDFRLADRKRQVVDVNKIANPRTGTLFDWESPQGKFRQDALDHLARLDSVGWDQTFYLIIKRLYDDKRMEPVLKFQLLPVFLDVACRGSHCLEQAFAVHVERLENAVVDTSANWIDPENSDGKTARDNASRELARLAAPDQAPLQKIVELMQKLRNPQFGPTYQWVGWLHRDMSEAWTCDFRLRLTSATLYVVRRSAAGEPVQFDRIGEINDGDFRLDENVATGILIEGRPVYIAVDPRRSS